MKVIRNRSIIIFFIMFIVALFFRTETIEAAIISATGYGDSCRYMAPVSAGYETTHYLSAPSMYSIVGYHTYDTTNQTVRNGNWSIIAPYDGYVIYITLTHFYTGDSNAQAYTTGFSYNATGWNSGSGALHTSSDLGCNSNYWGTSRYKITLSAGLTNFDVSAKNGSEVYIQTPSMPMNNPIITSYADGQKLNTNKPTITWNYSLPLNNPQAKYQVVGSKDGWATWHYNSGELNGSVMSHTTSALSDGNWSFAVRVFDGTKWSNDWGYRSNIVLDSTPSNLLLSQSPIDTWTKQPVAITASLSNNATVNSIEQIDQSTLYGRNFVRNGDLSQISTVNFPWDSTLNGNTIPLYWTVGYNDGVPNPTVGYHANINTSKFGYPVMTYPNKNEPFGYKDRWLGFAQAFSNGSFFENQLSVGAKVTISFDVYSDKVGGNIHGGFYRANKNTGSYEFPGSKRVYTTKANTWERLSFTQTMDANWDFNKDFSVYLYGEGDNEATKWIKNIKIELGDKATPFTLSPEDVVLSSNKKQYGVSVNGTYTYEATDNNGNKSSNSITIDNIDLDAPVHVSDSITGAAYVNGNDYWMKPGQTFTTKIRGNDAASGMYTMAHIFENSASHNWIYYNVAYNIADSAYEGISGFLDLNNYFSINSFNETYDNGKEAETALTLTVKEMTSVSPFHFKYSMHDLLSTYTPDLYTGKRIIIDGEKPTGILSKDVSDWTNGNVTITATGSDGTGSGIKRIKKPDGSYVNASSAIYSVSTNGTYLFEFEDNVGNTKTESITVSNIDKQNPTVMLDPASREWDKDDISVGLTFDDTGSSLYKEYRYAWTESTEKPTTGWSSFSTETTPILVKNTNGKWYLHVEVKDNAGNTGYAYGGVYKLDNTAPELTVDSSEIESGGTFSYLVRNKVIFTGIVNEDNPDSSVHVFYAVKNTSTNQNVVESVLVFEQNNHVTNANFAGSYTIDSSVRNGKYELTFYAVNDVGLVTIVTIPFEVANPAMATIQLDAFPQPTGKWTNSYMNLYVTESGDYELLKNAVRKYEITNSPTFPSTLTKTISDNKKITLDKVGENYVHIQYVLEDGSKVSTTVGPYLIDTSEIDEFEVKLVDKNGSKINGWTNQVAFLSIGDPAPIPISSIQKQYRIENYHTDWQTYREGTKINLEGEHRIFARIVNKAGNMSEQKMTISKIDNENPIIKRMSLEKTTDGTYQVQILAEDRLSGVQKIVVDDSIELTSHSKDLSSKPNYVTVTDHAKNITEPVSFAEMPIVTFEEPYTLGTEVYKKDVKATITGGTNLSYKLGNKVYECKEASCTVTISRNTTFTVFNTDGIKESKITYVISNIDKTEARLLLSGERDVIDPAKITFKWNYNLTNGTLTCIEGGATKTYDVSSRSFSFVGKNYTYDCYIEAEYGGELLKSNHVMIYTDSSIPNEPGEELSESAVHHNVYIEETGIGTGYFINVRRDNYKYDTLPIPKNEITHR